MSAFPLILDFLRYSFTEAAEAQTSNLTHVDGNRSPLAQATGSSLYPLLSIQDAIDSVAIGTTQSDYQTPKFIDIAPQFSYLESLDVDIRKSIVLMSSGNWNLGDFSAFGGSQTGVRRNITISGDASFVDGVSPNFKILGNSPERVSTAGFPNISGQILNTQVNRGGGITMEARVWGSNSGGTGTSIDMTGGSPSNFIMNKCAMNGGVDLNGGVAWLDDCQLQGDTMNLGAIVLATRCDIDIADMNLSGAFDATAFFNPSGFVDCGFSRPLNYTWTTGLTPFLVDALTNKRSKDVVVTLGGGATKIIDGDLTA